MTIFTVQTKCFGPIEVDVEVRADGESAMATCRKSKGMTDAWFEPRFGSGSWTKNYDLDNLEEYAQRHVRDYLGHGLK